jgi:hypothetical protein
VIIIFLPPEEARTFETRIAGRSRIWRNVSALPATSLEDQLLPRVSVRDGLQPPE